MIRKCAGCDNNVSFLEEDINLQKEVTCTNCGCQMILSSTGNMLVFSKKKWKLIPKANTEIQLAVEKQPAQEQTQSPQNQRRSINIQCYSCGCQVSFPDNGATKTRYRTCKSCGTKVELFFEADTNSYTYYPYEENASSDSGSNRDYQAPNEEDGIGMKILKGLGKFALGVGKVLWDNREAIQRTVNNYNERQERQQRELEDFNRRSESVLRKVDQDIAFNRITDTATFDEDIEELSKLADEALEKAKRQ